MMSHHPAMLEELADLRRRDVQRMFGTRTRTRPRHLPVDRGAVRDVLPVLAGVMPFAFFIGVQIDATPTNHAGALAGSLLLYAGSAHVSVLTLMGQGAGVTSMLIAVLLVNSRFMVYSAGLAPRFAAQPRWFRLLAPHFVIDQTYALTSRRGDLNDRARFRRYWITIGSVIGAAWASAMAVGVIAGPAIPRSTAVTSVAVWVLLGLLVPALRGRAEIVAAVTACLVALTVALPTSTRVLLGIVVGTLVGLITRRVRR
jgi:predicted branched-subunit amino acid permease